MNNAIKPKSGLLLRKVGSKHILVEVCNEQANLTDVFTLNTTAATLWERINAGAYTPEELAGWLCAEFETDAATALTDVRKQIDEWISFGLIE